jgi:DNA repair protein RecN (Recombination protein N)
MLDFLRIRNLALIDDVELEFAPGLNVLTGESGAGKSFILRALDFILGERISAAMVRPGRDKAQVEAIFALPEGELVLRRELLASTGRSRLYINDAIGSQQRIAALKSRLLIHTSQHGQQKLLSPTYHARILDGFLEDQALPEVFAARLQEVQSILSRQQEVRDRVQSLEDKREFLEYQQGEIAKVDPRPGEEEELMERRAEARSRVEARESSRAAMDVLYGESDGLSDRIAGLKQAVTDLSRADDQFSGYVESLEDVADMLRELERSIRALPAVDGDDETDAIESRLFELTQLERRLKRPLVKILELQAEIEENLSFLDESRLALTQLEREEKEAAARLAETTERLNAQRMAAAEVLRESLETELRFLGFSEHVCVVFDFRDVEIHSGIIEKRPRILWVPNPGQPAQPLDRIASGGELSRFLLAVVGLQAREQSPTLLFDEVDSGIGGVTLGQVADRIRALADRQQVILITHWPQLAGRADRHFQIRKVVRDGETYTLCAPLGRPAVIDELARMTGGGAQARVMAEGLIK